MILAIFSCLISVEFIKRTDAAPQIVIEKPLSGTVFDFQSDVTLSSTTTPNVDIAINTKDGEYARVTADKDGKWSHTIPTVSEGSQTIEVKAIERLMHYPSKLPQRT